MKKTGLLIMTVFLLLCGGCRQADVGTELGTDAVRDGEVTSYTKLEKQEEVTIEGNLATIVLPEDQALPYRWEIISQSTGVTVKSDNTVDDPYVFMLAEGSSPAFRVFELELSGEKDIIVKLVNMWLYSEDIGEANGERTYKIEYSQTGWSVKE